MNYAYNYNPYQGYPGGYVPQAQDQLSQLRQGYQPVQQAAPQTQPAANGINWCQGEAAARAYMVAPGNTVLLMDSDASTFYLKSSDANGMPQPLRIFDYQERAAAPRAVPQAQQEQYVTRREFDALAAKLEAVGTEKRPVKGGKQKEDSENA